MRKLVVLGILALLVACGTPRASESEVATRIAEGVIATLTASAPTATALPVETPTPKPSPTVAPSNTATNTRVAASPTATFTPAPPTATPRPSYGTRGNPVPRGQDWLAPDGWQIVVLDFNSDAWPVVQAENMFNDPPKPGNRMVMLRVRITNVAAEQEPAWNSESSFYLVGSYGVLRSTFDESSSCGVIPDELSAQLFRGGSTEGNVCFQMPADETDLRLAYQHSIWGEYLFFAVQ